jgi:hypothetical protein
MILSSLAGLPVAQHLIVARAAAGRSVVELSGIGIDSPARGQRVGLFARMPRGSPRMDGRHYRVANKLRHKAKSGVPARWVLSSFR